MRSSPLFIGVFILGCVTAKFIPIEIPKANAGAKSGMENWCISTSLAINEYELHPKTQKDYDKWNRFLKKVNKEGWKIVDVQAVGAAHVSGVIGACFERPMK